MPDEAVSSPLQDIRKHAFRALLACGLLFTLLLLMGLTGVASITLVYEDPLYTESMKGFEGDVVNIVVALKPFIKFMHVWGGYFGIALAGWAGVEVFSFGRRLKKTDDAGWRSSGRKLPWVGVVGSAVLIASLLLLIPSGVAAAGVLKSGGPDRIENIDNPAHLPAGERPDGETDPEFVIWHTRELNYLMALGAIILVFAASSIRKVALDAKKQIAEKED